LRCEAVSVSAITLFLGYIFENIIDWKMKTYLFDFIMQDYRLSNSWETSTLLKLTSLQGIRERITRCICYISKIVN
jgi:hypothetical protein